MRYYRVNATATIEVEANNLEEAIDKAQEIENSQWELMDAWSLDEDENADPYEYEDRWGCKALL